MTEVLDLIGEQLQRAAERRVRARSFRRRRGYASLGWRWMGGGTRRVIVLLAVVVVLASAGGLALAGTFSSGTIGPQAWVDGRRVQPETAPTPDQTASLAILSRSQVASDTLDPYDSQVLTNSPAAGDGANPSLARRVAGFTSGAAWLVPANDGMVCLVAENAQGLAMNSEPGPWQNHTRVPGANGATQCTPAANVSTGVGAGYSYTAETPGMYFTAGLVPDGVNQVTVTLADGRAIPLPAYENVYMGEIPGAPESITFNSPTGPKTISP